MTTLGIAIYDPRRLDPETFLAGFVARGEFVAFLLDKLRHMPELGEHFLIVGPRGMGKTSLLRRLAIGISAEPALRARFIPLSFREEQYNVRSLDAFWRNCAESLAEWCEDGGRQEAADDIDRSLGRAEWHEPNSAGDAFLALCKQLGGRPVLFVDNLDLILDALSPQQNWELRRALQAPGGPIVFGAATQMLRQSAERKAAFYEFFHPHTLHPLSEGELRHCMYRLSEARGEFGRPVREVLEREPGRITTLHTLTGGNPRVLTLVYQLLERTESDSVFRDLEVLLDQLTPYYKARVEEYQTDLQRAVIDAIALNWHPVGAARLSEVTAVEVTTISSQLARLKRDGLIEEVETSGARAGYQFVERFFNIWYLMRHGSRRTRQKVAWLTAFLSSFYAPSELAKMKAEAMAAGRTLLHPFYREALEAADTEFERMMEGARLLTSESPLGLAPSSETTNAELGSARAEIGRRIDQADELASSGRHEEALAIYDEVVSRFGQAMEPALCGEAARALFNKGVTLGDLGRSEDEVAVYDEVLRRFGAAEQPELREQVARALVNKGVTLGALGRGEDAVVVYDEVVNRFGAAEEPELREQVARALVNKGFRLGALGRGEDAVVVYDEVLNRFGAAEEPELREQVARALVNKGLRLGALGRGEDAVVVYDEVLNRFGAAEEPELREQVARALVNKGGTLGALGRNEDAVAVYDEVVNQFGETEQPQLRGLVARALFNKGFRLGELGRSEDEVAVYDEVLRRFGAAEQPELRVLVARALFNKGFALGALGRGADAVAAYDDVVSRFDAAEEHELRADVALAMCGTSKSLIELGRFSEAEQHARRSVEHDPVSYFGWYWLGNVLADHSGETEEAEAAYRRAIEIGDASVMAEANLVWLLISSDQLAEADPLLAELRDLHPVGRDLLEAARALASDNFGEAAEYLQRALEGDQGQLHSTFSDDLLRLLRIAVKRGYGEKLIAWFNQSGQADRQAPVYAAFVAFVRGERFLLDFSPEIRKPAQSIFRWLNSRSELSAPTPAKPARKRGRPPRKRNTL